MPPAKATSSWKEPSSLGPTVYTSEGAGQQCSRIDVKATGPENLGFLTDRMAVSDDAPNNGTLSKNEGIRHVERSNEGEEHWNPDDATSQNTGNDTDRPVTPPVRRSPQQSKAMTSSFQQRRQLNRHRRTRPAIQPRIRTKPARTSPMKSSPTTVTLS